jgi:alpha-tubulin suppressor-like RCC1 family protein
MLIRIFGYRVGHRVRPHAHSSARIDRNVLPAACTLLAALAGGCIDDDMLLYPAAQGEARLEIAYSRTASTQRLAEADQARILVARSDSLIHESIHDLAPDATETRIEIALDVVGATETLHVLVELRADGVVLARGFQTLTVQRDGMNSTTVTPDAVADDIAVGGSQACVLDLDGAAYCWGSNAAGLGAGIEFGTTRLVPVAGGLRFVAIEAGFQHVCALTAAGQAYCWGDNGRGQLGDGSTTWRFTPVPAAGTLRFVELALGAAQSCGRTETGVVHCWGGNQYGQLGSPGAGAFSTTPVAVSGGHTFDAIDSALWENCGIAGGQILCWGLQWPSADILPSPTLVPAPEPMRTLAVGVVHNCALAESLQAYCWSRASNYPYGATGTGSAAPPATPTAVVGGHTFATIETPTANDITAGHTCAVDVAGELFCWGLNDAGQLGARATDTCVIPLDPPSNVECSHEPMPVAAPSFSAIALGQATCGIANFDEIFCWGDNTHGLLANGDYRNQSTPMRVHPDASLPVLEVIDLPPSPISLPAGQVAVVRADAADQTGSLLRVAYDWSISDTTVISFNEPGSTTPSTGPRAEVRVFGKSVGSAVLRASAAGRSDSVTVVVR